MLGRIGIGVVTAGLLASVAPVTSPSKVLPRPALGVCATAKGLARGSAVHLALSHSDGRYLLAHLRPGRYALRTTNCGRATLSTAIAWPAGPAGVVASGKSGSISGRVTGNGRPLARICAVAIPSDAYPLRAPEPRATTSKTGRYRIRGLRPGRYLVVFRTGLPSCPADANWLPQWYPLQDSSYPPDQAAEVRVRAGRDIAHVDGRLHLGGEIAGVVRTKAGKPVSGVCVNVYTAFQFNGIYIVTAAAVSRKAGRYALRGLFRGSYQIQFSIGCGGKGDYAPQWWRDQRSPDHASSIKVTGRRVVKGIDAALRPGGAITGTVRARTAAKMPVAGVCVFASEKAGADSAGATTARNGTYRLDGLETGRYQVTFDPTCGGDVNARYLQASRTVSVRASRTRSGVNAYLRPAAGISGVVLNQAGEPVRACVTISDRNNDFAVTNSHGRYLLAGVAPGRYTVEFDDCGDSGSLASQWYDNRPNTGSADPVRLTAGKITPNIDATMPPGATLQGFLTTRGGRPVNGGCVAALSQEGSLGDFDSAGDETTTVSNGYYAITDLTPGLYQVSFDCPFGRYASQWFRSEPDATTAGYIALDPGPRTIVNAELGLAGAIKGTVTDKAGRPIPGLCVNVANARNGQLIPPAGDGAMTDNHGRYLIGQLTPGRYLVQFSDCDNDTYGAQWYRGSNNEAFATPVTVRAGRATAGINGVLTKGGTISGTVTGPDGKPAVDMCVVAADPATAFFSDLFFVGENGRYRVTGLSTGRYELSIYNCGPATANLASALKQVRVIAPRSVTGADARLAAGGTITGTVTGGPADQGPLGQACVLAVATRPNGGFPVAWTDNSGRYVLTGLAAGTYRVYLADPSCDDAFGIPGLAPQWFSNQPDQRTASLVTVSAGRTATGVSATLRPSGGIQGRVTTRSQAAVTGECVIAVPFRASPDPASGLLPAPDIAISKSTGRYRLLDLLPGRYKIEFTTGCGDAGFTRQWWNDAASASKARVITVGDTTVTGINAALRR